MNALQERDAELRRHYARLVTRSVGADDPRLEHAFATVPREHFLPPGPWQVRARDGYIKVPRNDTGYIYQDVLIALDAERGINNGEPSLHARWMAAIAPQPGETVVHIGAGGGYYSAILAMLVEPGGVVEAYEVDHWLASLARNRLASYRNVRLHEADAGSALLPRADIIYVNAGIACLPLGWLGALSPGGRLIFPWQPDSRTGLTLVVIRQSEHEGPEGYLVRPLVYSSFIDCEGAAGERPLICPASGQAHKVRSIWLSSERAPDGTAIAVCGDIWFSSEALEAFNEAHLLSG